MSLLLPLQRDDTVSSRNLGTQWGGSSSSYYQKQTRTREQCRRDKCIISLSFGNAKRWWCPDTKTTSLPWCLCVDDDTLVLSQQLWHYAHVSRNTTSFCLCLLRLPPPPSPTCCATRHNNNISAESLLLLQSCLSNIFCLARTVAFLSLRVYVQNMQQQRLTTVTLMLSIEKNGNRQRLWPHAAFYPVAAVGGKLPTMQVLVKDRKRCTVVSRWVPSSTIFVSKTVHIVRWLRFSWHSSSI